MHSLIEVDSKETKKAKGVNKNVAKTQGIKKWKHEKNTK